MPNGITFNGVHSSNIDGIEGVLIYDFPMIPEMENRILEIAGMTGQADGGRVIKARPFPITFLMKKDTIQEYFTTQFEIENWLNVNEAGEFIFDALPDKRIFARPTKMVTPERSGNWSKFEVEFTAFQPYFEAIAETSHALVTAEKYPYNGNKETDYVLNVTADVAVNPLTIWNGENNNMLILHKQINIGDVIQVDTKRRIVTVNGMDERANLDIDSRYWKIVDPYSFSTNLTVPTMNVAYRERW